MKIPTTAAEWNEISQNRLDELSPEMATIGRLQEILDTFAARIAPIEDNSIPVFFDRDEIQVLNLALNYVMASHYAMNGSDLN